MTARAAPPRTSRSSPAPITAAPRPCADALVAAGVRRVVVAIEDPDRRVAGAGIQRLRDAGIAVEVGEGARAATVLLAPYLHHRRTGRPYFVAKVASSLDGRVAAADGTSQWITSADARADAHELRADSQAIVDRIGDRARRPSGADRARRRAAAPPCAAAGRARRARAACPRRARCSTRRVAPTLVVTTEWADPADVDAWGAAGAKVAVVGAGADGGVDLDEATTVLAREGVLQALVEGGGTLLGAVLSEAARVSASSRTSHRSLLGESGRPGYAFAGPPTLDAVARYELVDVTRFGPDVRLTYEVG